MALLDSPTRAARPAAPAAGSPARSSTRCSPPRASQPTAVHAIRVFADLVPGSLLDLEPGATAALVELEHAVADRPEYLPLAASSTSSPSADQSDWSRTRERRHVGAARRSCTSTWTRSTHRSPSATGPSCGTYPVIVGGRLPRRGAVGQLPRPGVRRPVGDADDPGPPAVPAGGGGPARLRHLRAGVVLGAWRPSGGSRPLVEVLSLDEAFLDVRGSTRRLGSPLDIAEQLRATIHDEQGITCSVGVAASVSVAKLASRRAKPDGVLVVPPDTVTSFLHPLDVGELWGVGEKTQAMLHRLGLVTVGDVAHTPLRTLQRAVGDHLGSHLHELAWGTDRSDRRRGARVLRQGRGRPRQVHGRRRDLRPRHRRPQRDPARAAAADGQGDRPDAGGRGGRSHRHDQGPVRRLHHDHPLPHPPRGDRRDPGDLPHRHRSVRRPRAAAGPDPAGGGPGRGAGAAGDRPPAAGPRGAASTAGPKPTGPSTGPLSGSARRPSVPPACCPDPT